MAAGTALRILGVSIISAWPRQAAHLGEFRGSDFRTLVNIKDTPVDLVKLIANTLTAITRG